MTHDSIHNIRFKVNLTVKFLLIFKTMDILYDMYVYHYVVSYILLHYLILPQDKRRTPALQTLLSLCSRVQQAWFCHLILSSPPTRTDINWFSSVTK